VKDQHTKIKGYRDLSAEEIALMNEGKELAQKVGEFVEKLEAAEFAQTTIKLRTNAGWPSAKLTCRKALWP
jgi:hypothetical protein